jgi:hypothetical protein
VSVTFRGLTFGSTATGFVVPTLAQWRGALADYARELSGYFNLQTQPGSLYGIFIDLISAGVDIASGNAFDVVGRTIFTAMQGVALDQFIADYMRRVVETPSTATVYVYGAPGSVVPAATAVRTSQVGVPFAFLGAVNLPAAPSVAYGIEVLNFAAGAQSGQLFRVVVDGTNADYVANNLDTGATVTAGLVASVNALLQTQTAYAGGVNPNNSRPTLVVTDLTGAGVFPLSVSGPVGTITAYVAASGATDTGAVLGPTYAPAQSLRYGEPVAGVQGYTNIVAAVPGRVRETDSQLRARYQVAQRGRGGASPDAITAIILSPVEVGGGGATFCSTEYNPTDDDSHRGGHERRLKGRTRSCRGARRARTTGGAAVARATQARGPEHAPRGRGRRGHDQPPGRLHRRRWGRARGRGHDPQGTGPPGPRGPQGAASVVAV